MSEQSNNASEQSIEQQIAQHALDFEPLQRACDTYAREQLKIEPDAVIGETIDESDPRYNEYYKLYSERARELITGAIAHV